MVVAARGANPRNSYEQPGNPVPRSTSRPAEALQPNSPSCGNQPAHISLTARRRDTHTTTGHRLAKHSKSAQKKTFRTLILPAYLTELPTYQLY